MTGGVIPLHSTQVMTRQYFLQLPPGKMDIDLQFLLKHEHSLWERRPTADHTEKIHQGDLVFPHLIAGVK